jgi:Protein of unknown function (DUF4232)
MKVEELESIIRDELRRDAANAPAGRQLRTAVLDAVTDLPMAERSVRRWAVPLLVAAAVVALAVAATLLPRAFGKHSQPAHPKPTPSPSLPAAPTSVDLRCANGQQQVTGASTRYSNSAGDFRYVYEYYCAGADGSRTGSFVNAYRMVGGRLVFDQALLLGGPQQYVMSMTGLADALRIRVYDAAIPVTISGPVGEVQDLAFDVDGDSGSGVTPVAQPCLATDLTVRTPQASEPTPHFVLQLTNHGGKACAVWGNPRYRQVGGTTPVKFSSVLRGPAGGLAGEPSAAPLLLQPGQSAYSAIGYDPSAPGGCAVEDTAAALANGVQLGNVHYVACSVVSYPLVSAENGSETRP